MKPIILSLILATVLFAACNNGANKKVSENDTTTMESANHDGAVNNTPVNDLLTGYLKIKNALTNDNNKEAASAATELVKAFEGFNKTALTPEQAKVYNDIEEDAREHAEHIGSNAGNIEHQREHFETLSEEVYELVKVTGAGQKLYFTNCPMYNDNKGANWLSETKEIQNPYLGQSMATCGTIKEEIN